MDATSSSKQIKGNNEAITASVVPSDSGSTSPHSDLGLTDDEDDKWKCNVPDKNCDHSVDFESTWFATGKFRYAYMGHWCDSHGGAISHGKKHGQLCVVKKWKKRHVYDAMFWDRDVRIAEIADKLARKWNKKFSGNDLRRIRVLQPTKMNCVHEYKQNESTNESKNKKEEKHNGCRKDGVVLGERLIVEDYLSGNFIKWNSNSGWFRHENSMIQAFCHWTYHYSGTKVLFCDAQGMFVYMLIDNGLCSCNCKAI